MKKLLILFLLMIIIYFFYFIKEDLTIIYNINRIPTSYTQISPNRYNGYYSPRLFFLRNYFYPIS